VSRSTHPLERWPTRHRRLAAILVIAVALAPSIASPIVEPLHEGETGEGIVQFEFAGSVDRAQEILDTWRAEGVLDQAAFIQGVDLLYPLIYGAALVAGCVAAAGAWRRAGRPRVADACVVVAWIAPAAVLFDYVENLGLTVSLLGEPASPWPQLAFAAAALKFATIALALLFALSGFVALAVRSRRPVA
jgi:hypothetical protein